METIKTKLLGERQLRSKEKIDGVDGLYIVEIYISPTKFIGIIDENNNEVVSFWTIKEIGNITVLNDKTVVIDHFYYVKSDFSSYQYKVYNSILCVKKEDGFKKVFSTNVGPFNIDDHKLVGANIDKDDRFADLVIFEYEYQKGIEYKHDLGRWVYDADRLDEYLHMRVSSQTQLSRRLDGKN